ncbi:MAG: glutathione S-transferase family protein [bacterium]
MSEQQKRADPHAPYRVYKMDISYFSGKFEGYLRYKGIPYTPVETDARVFKRVYAHTGIQKVPAVETADGKWLFDTTPMIRWFEKQYPEPPVLPSDPALAFIALLIEDYGDEWLWRPAMWWRWVPRVSRWALGWRIAGAIVPAPLTRLYGWLFGQRQLREWVWGDGVTRKNSHTVRDMLFRELEFLEAVLSDQPFLLGSHPSVADFGYFASMFRHFGNDPDPAEVMRRQAPRTYEWLARLWNLSIDKLPRDPEWVWPRADCWRPLLNRIVKDYLPYLHQNARAHHEGRKRFDYRGETSRFPKTKTTTYRVWCREVLQQRYSELPVDARKKVDDLFAGSGGLAILFADGVIASGLAGRFQLPLDPNTADPVKKSLKIALFGKPRN